MRYFLRLAEGVPVLPLTEQVARHFELWNEDRARTAFEGSPHAAAQDMLLRCCDTKQPLADAYGDLEAVDRPAMAALRAKPLVLDLLKLVGGSRLGRVVVTRLEPGKKITAHADEGPYANYYTRYHVVLIGLPGSTFYCGDEAVNMKTGDIYWFDHKAEHRVDNNSKDDRVHMLVDIRIDP